MLRIRRRFALLICCGCLLIFLSLYVILNFAAPAPNAKKSNYFALESKLHHQENGAQNHGHGKEMSRNARQSLDKRPAKAKDILEHRDIQGDGETEECSDVVRQVPEVDIQMLEMYDRMSFADVDGGVWKQGWNIKYDLLTYNHHHKLKVFVVPHSHNDPGWIQTFEDYYNADTKHILSNALRHLTENPDMKFIWAEISYFSRFYEDLGENKKQQMKLLVKKGQLEFVTGGWVMPDEANSHWRNVLLQLTEGQTWLKEHFNITPTSSWAIDPFGHSPSLPYVLQRSGFKNLLIQRTHYSVKKELAQQRNLEFYWRQIWETRGNAALFTHMMPFYSYDIPHTCGPDPKVCCQFDFKRIGSFGLSCPWRVPPRAIDDNNVAARSELLVDQWKKKAELYRTNTLLVPLGDDFRYKQNTEWDVQRVNYERLFEYINGHYAFNVEAQFGTLQEYFDAVHNTGQSFPSLSGDFFTYADRSDNYWSGYYTSRPYYKRMDRVLMHYLRAAEMLNSWKSWDSNAGFAQKLELARRELSLFQHHDGITGTAKTHVVLDYERRMIEALKACHFVMQQAIYRLLTNPTIYTPDYNFHYFTLDDSRWPGVGVEESRITIILGEELPNKHVVLHNTLPHWRQQLIDFYVSSPFISVSDLAGNTVKAQVSPVWSWHHDTLSKTVNPQGSTTKFRIIFEARVPPMGLVTYVLTVTDSKPTHTSFASQLLLNSNSLSVSLGQYPEVVKFGDHRELALRVGSGPTLAFSEHGMLKSMQLTPDSPHVPVHLKFLKYGTRSHGDKSGAYLFLPNGPALSMMTGASPVVLVSEGELESYVSVGLPQVIHQTILRGNDLPEIRNLVDIGDIDNTEVVMRLQTHIDSGDTFYTDLNGLQLIKRRRFEKLPLQANYYPVPSAIFIEDANMRLTLLTGQPLGGSSLAPGELEIMQDRRLASDDQRGLGQGVLDNKPVLHIYRIVLEKIIGCERPPEAHPGSYLTSAAYRASQSLLDPLDKFIYSENEWTGAQEVFGNDHVPANEATDVVVMRRLSKSTANVQRIGCVLHRTQLMECSNAPLEDKFNACNLLQNSDDPSVSCHRSTLTFLQILENLEHKVAPVPCPMETNAYIISFSAKNHS
ncbi:alpha-mannosidase 2 isoform X1 [Drosophila sulfurigaster albostrigata]|uniref:alpha-mannosidase 2 isoform X1 n=2 Tax=Drosophila sulfurigaster albostrigata TaxID=89887 RepID=UPI002D21DA3A|nr:alpha-mannosidase 2 isoform X1 [Drosophila sulfurigaster albostrigata]